MQCGCHIRAGNLLATRSGDLVYLGAFCLLSRCTNQQATHARRMTIDLSAYLFTVVFF